MNLFSLPYLQLSIAVHGINGQKPSGSVLLVAKLRWEDYIIHCGWEFRQWSVTCQVGVSPVYWWVISMTSPDAPNSGFPQRVWPRFVWLSKSHKPRVGKALSHAQNQIWASIFFPPELLTPPPCSARARTWRCVFCFHMVQRVAGLFRPSRGEVPKFGMALNTCVP